MSAESIKAAKQRAISRAGILSSLDAFYAGKSTAGKSTTKSAEEVSKFNAVNLKRKDSNSSIIGSESPAPVTLKRESSTSDVGVEENPGTPRTVGKSGIVNVLKQFISCSYNYNSVKSMIYKVRSQPACR